MIEAVSGTPNEISGYGQKDRARFFKGLGMTAGEITVGIEADFSIPNEPSDYGQKGSARFHASLGMTPGAGGRALRYIRPVREGSVVTKGGRPQGVLLQARTGFEGGGCDRMVKGLRAAW